MGKENNWEEDYDSVKNADLYCIILEAVILIKENWSSVKFLSKENLYVVLNFMKLAKWIDIPSYIYNDFIVDYHKLNEEYRKLR